MEIQNQKQEKQIFWHCMAEGKRIENMEDGSYRVDDSYYVIPSLKGEQMVKQTDKGGKQRLLIPISLSNQKGTGKYELAW